MHGEGLSESDVTCLFQHLAENFVQHGINNASNGENTSDNRTQLHKEMEKSNRFLREFDSIRREVISNHPIV